MKKLLQIAAICLAFAASATSCDKDSNNMPEKGYSINSYFGEIDVTSPDTNKYPAKYTQTNKKVSLMTKLETPNLASLEIQSFIIYDIDKDSNGDNDVNTMLTISNIPQIENGIYQSTKLPLTMVFTTTTDNEDGSQSKSYKRVAAEAANINIKQSEQTLTVDFDLIFNSENEFAENGATFKISAIVE